MIKELLYLIKLLFTSQSQDVEIVKLNYFPFKGYSAMSWCGKIIIKDYEINDSTLQHEYIHLLQALQFKSWIRYYLMYLWYWIIGNPFSQSSYYTIPFEMEAYGNELNPDYKVTKDSWKKYIIKNRKDTFNANKYNWKSYCRKNPDLV